MQVLGKMNSTEEEMNKTVAESRTEVKSVKRNEEKSRPHEPLHSLRYVNLS